MSELTPDDEALISAARGGLEATPEDQARVKRKLFAQIGIGAGIAGSAISTSTAASAGAAAGAATTATVVAGTTLTTKLFLAVVLIGTAGGAIAIEHHATSPAPAAPTTIASAAPVQNAVPIPPPPPEVAPVITAAIPIPSANPSPSPNPIQKPSPTPNPTPNAIATPMAAITETPTPPQVTAVPTGPTTVDAEAALLRNADAALKSGDAPGALALVDQHAKQFPNGILAEERDAERIVVLCALGRTDEARAAGAAFLRARPRSPLASRVRASCAGN